jgi:hypothetical protein
MNGMVADLTGQRFGRLTVLHRAPANDSRGRSRWRCRCDCGDETIVRCDHLAGKHGPSTVSCGCFGKEQSGRRIAATNLAHGEAKRSGFSPEYRCWEGMLKRCRGGPDDKNFKYYGARGITVCKRWHDYSAFLADMGRKPGPKYTIDRINNDKGYEPDNCRWVTRSVQNSNQRRYVELQRGIRL